MKNSKIILKEIKIKTKLTEGFKKGKSLMASDIKLYNDLKPKMANMFDEYMINKSCDMPKTAGIESMAKMKSLNSIQTKHKKRGVGRYELFILDFVKNRSPSYLI